MNRTATIVAIGVVLALGCLLGRDLLAPRPVLGQVAKDAEVKEEKRVLTTSGTGTVRFRPDSARVFLLVDSQAPTILAARGLNNQDVKKVLDALKALQIPGLKMKSDNITVTQVFERQNSSTVDRLPKVLGYKVSYHFTALVESDDPTKLGESAGRILDTALANGANNLQQVMIFRKDQTSFRRQALTQAVEDALANARALATGAQKTIVDTTVISGEPQYMYFDNNVRMQNSIMPAQAVPSGGDATTVLSGDLEISCRVSLTCRY